jgi:hypothetical protein
MSSILAAIRQREAKRDMLVARIDALERAAAMPKVDRHTLRADLKRRTNEWREPLTANVPQARQLLRKVLADRLTVTPEGNADRYSTITGEGTLTKILAGIVFQRAWRPQRDSRLVECGELGQFGPRSATSFDRLHRTVHLRAQRGRMQRLHRPDYASNQTVVDNLVRGEFSTLSARTELPSERWLDGSQGPWDRRTCPRNASGPIPTPRRRLLRERPRGFRLRVLTEGTLAARLCPQARSSGCKHPKLPYQCRQLHGHTYAAARWPCKRAHALALRGSLRGRYGGMGEVIEPATRNSTVTSPPRSRTPARELFLQPTPRANKSRRCGDG